VDYLKGTATASATALFVLCRHLSKVDEARTKDELRAALQPLRSGRSDHADEPGGTGDALESSLKIGAGIGVLQEGARGSGWIVDPALHDSLQDASIDGWAWFRAELLRRINQNAMATIADKEQAPDLVLGMAWFLQQNPLTPLGTAWNGGAEEALEALNLRAVVGTAQWRAFLRWSIALGLARNVEAGRVKVCVADASTAIADQFPALPVSGRAQDWLGLLTKQLPIFGSPELLAALPQRRVPWLALPPAVSLGLLKLEKAGAIKMEPADDGRGIVAIGLGANSRQVGIITVTGEKA
jgi:hypothetical protein